MRSECVAAEGVCGCRGSARPVVAESKYFALLRLLCLGTRAHVCLVECEPANDRSFFGRALALIKKKIKKSFGGSFGPAGVYKDPEGRGAGRRRGREKPDLLLVALY